MMNNKPPCGPKPKPKPRPSGKMLFAALAAALATQGCMTSPAVYGDIPECERVVPKSLLEPVEGVDSPPGETHADGHVKAEPYMIALLEESGNVEKANDKAPAVDHIYRTCLALHREALRKAKRGFFGRLFGG